MIFINDLPETVCGQLRMFANDIKLFRDIQSREDCDALQADIDRLQEWPETWLLGFSAQK